MRRTEHVVRLVGGSNHDNGTINGAAFERPEKDADGLSFTRRLLLSKDSADDLNRIREILSSHLRIGATSVLAELPVGKVLARLAKVSSAFNFVDDPLDQDGEKLANPAHALLTGLPLKGEALGSLRSELIGDMIAQEVVDVHPATLSPHPAEKSRTSS